MIRRIAVIFLIAFAAMWAFSAEAAGRRRAVDKGGTIVYPNKSVEMILPVLYSSTPEGEEVMVIAQSVIPLTAGKTFSAYVQKPGQSEWKLTYTTTTSSSEIGWYKTLYLYSGTQFCDEMADGTCQPWLPGIAPFKVVIQDPGQLTTSVTTQVVVPAQGVSGEYSVLLGPIQKVVPSSDGRRALLVGDLPGKPTLQWFHEVGAGMFAPYPVEMGIDHSVPIPSKIAGSSAFLLACFGYPHSQCGTYWVEDLPLQSQN